MTAFLDVVSDGLAIEDYIEGQRALDLRTPWDKTPKEIEMDHESQMERHIGSEPLIPTQGTELAQYLGPQKDQLASSQCEHSMFQRVPDEILLMIVSNISDPSDKPSLFAFYALRQASRRFRRFLKAEDFIYHPFSHSGCCQQCSDGYRNRHTMPICPPAGHHCFEYKSVGEAKIMAGAVRIKGRWEAGGFGDFIRSYTTCKNCQENREERIKAGYSTACKFSACHSHDFLHCHSCKVDHPSACFSQDEADLTNGRVCIATEGFIRVCDHKTLTRADIRILLPSEVLEDKPLFLTSCEHPDHKTPCSSSVDTTDQSPRVFATNYSGYGIMLHILWQGHSGSDPSILHQSGYLHRHKLNESLEKIRQKGGRHLLPKSGTNTLPEWNAISEIDRSELVSTEEDLIKLRGGWGYMNRERRHDLTHLGPERIACGHCKNDKSCIVVNYHSKIRFTDGGFHGPPHEWFHAIDRKSYVYNGTVGVPETCHDDGCRNYYKGKDDQVDQWSQMVNWFCEIGDNHSGDRSCTFADKPKQPYEDGRPAFTPWDLYKVKGSEEALAPSASPICFYLNRLTTGILGSFDRQHWRTGRAQFSAD
jgi:hypothetical protein